MHRVVVLSRHCAIIEGELIVARRTTVHKRIATSWEQSRVQLLSARLLHSSKSKKVTKENKIETQNKKPGFSVSQSIAVGRNSELYTGYFLARLMA